MINLLGKSSTSSKIKMLKSAIRSTFFHNFIPELLIAFFNVFRYNRCIINEMRLCMRKLLILGLMLFIGLGMSKLKAAPLASYNIVTNPGADMAHEVNVNWHSDIEGTYLEYTIATDTNYVNKVVVQGEYRNFTAPKGANINGFGDRFIVSANLTNLEANTKYMYRVGKAGSFSKNYYFTTAHEGAFSFLHITDPQYYSQSTANIFNNLMGKAYTINPDIAFTFFTGDIIDKGGDETQWQMFFNASNLSRNTVATVPGNHEYYDALGSGSYFEDFYQANYNNPKNGAEGTINTNYYFRYYNTLFIAINSEAKSMVKQKVWFEDVIKQNSDAKYIIVGMHRSMYGSIYASDSIAVRANWQPLFDKYGVDLVLSGHDHIYSRSKHIYNDKISTDPLRGTTYIIGGSGGQKYYPVTQNEKYAKVIEKTSCANIITVSDIGITINVINTNGDTIDELSQPIKSKRIGTIDPNFTKIAFEASIIVKGNEETRNMGTIEWDKNGYGNVLTVGVYDSSEILLKEAYFYNQSLNKFEFSGIIVNKINQLTVKIVYQDLSTASLTYSIDATIPVPIVHLTITEALDLIKNTFNEKVVGIFKNEK